MMGVGGACNIDISSHLLITVERFKNRFRQSSSKLRNHRNRGDNRLYDFVIGRASIRLNQQWLHLLLNEANSYF